MYTSASQDVAAFDPSLLVFQTSPDTTVFLSLAMLAWVSPILSHTLQNKATLRIITADSVTFAASSTNTS